MKRKKQRYIIKIPRIAFCPKISMFLPSIFYLLGFSLCCLFVLSCHRVGSEGFVFPSRYETSSSRLMHPQSSYYSRALFDNKLNSPWISGNSLQHGYEFVSMEFDQSVYLSELHLFIGFLPQPENNSAETICEEELKTNHQYRNLDPNLKHQQYPFQCLYKESIQQYSRPKKISIEVLFQDGSKDTDRADITESGETLPYWWRATLDDSWQRRPVKNIKIVFSDFYYGLSYTNIAIGELKLLGLAQKDMINQAGRNRLQDWIKRHEMRLIGREYIFGKTCRLVDGTEYLFAVDGKYQFRTGFTTASLGSERGEYFFNEKGVYVRYYRFEVHNNEQRTEDDGEKEFIGVNERYMNINYLRPGFVQILGQLCRIIDS